MDDFLCYGDFVSLYNDEQGGYVYSNHSSSAFNEVAVSSGGSKNKPLDVNVLTFEICPPTRYQFSSHYRDLTTASTNRDLTNADPTKRDLTKSTTNETDNENQTQSVYEAEQSFNAAEIIRQRGKPVCYGQTVQFRHKFTNKFVQISNITTSYLEKQNGSVSLQSGDSINGQFRILPKHKYRREGDQVRLAERLVFESIACPSNYLHVSEEQFNKETFVYNKQFELNMSSWQSTFFILRNSSPLVEGDTKLKNGDVVRFYHYELQGYLVGEGYFGRDILENVHLRLRPLNREHPHSLQSSSSAITYWQIEEVAKTMTDGYIRQSSTVRLLHLCTRRYLCLDPSGKGADVTLTADPQDKSSQFKLVSVDEGTGDIKFKSTYCLEAVSSGHWIHATNDQYKKLQKEIDADSRPLESLPISKAKLCSVKASSSSSTGDFFNEKQFEDLFVLEKVDDIDYKHYTFVAGMVPYLFKKHVAIIQDHTISRNIVKCFKEMIEFMAVDGKPVKKRQKLFRNLGVIDRMLEFLRETFQPQNKHMPTLFSLVYDVLRAYVSGSSRKNKTHVARHMSLYFGHFSYHEGQVHQHAADMVNEFIRDNKDVLERITNDDMTKLVDFIRRDKEYRFLELMDNFCVCQNKAVKDNQKYITNSWLKSETRNCLFFTKMGREIGRKDEEERVVFVTVDNARSWLNLCTELTQDPKRKADSLFFYHQLQTFERLCFGRNSYAIETLTSDLKYVTKEQAKVCLENTQLPEKFRALYCQLIIALFLNTQEIQKMIHPIEELYFYSMDSSSMPEENNNGVDMEYLKDLDLEAFVRSYITNSTIQTSIKVGTNKLTAQVLSLLNRLILLGRHQADIGTLGELVNLLNGLTDKPAEEEEEKEEMYTKEERFMRSESTSAIVEAKIQCLKVIETYFDHVLRSRIKGLLSTFTQIRRSGVTEVIDPTIESEDTARFFSTAKDILQDLFTNTAMFMGVDLPVIMVDLTKYQYENLVTASMETLYLYFSSIHTLLKHAARVQVLTSTSKSAKKCAKIHTSMAFIKDRLDSKLSDADASEISNMMQKFQRVCKHKDGTPNTTLQNFLFAHGIMDHIFTIMTSKELQDLDASSLQTISLKLLEALTINNEQIQNSVFLKLDLLLTMHKHLDHVFPVVKAMFAGNVRTCKQVTDQQICVMVKYLAAEGSRYTIVFDILQTLVKPERLGLPLRRNQNLVMRHMTEIRSKISYLFAMDDQSLVSFLSDKDGPNVKDFLATLDLMATCAQNGSKENKASLRSAIDVHLLLMILTKTGVSHARLRPCLRALTYAYCEGFFDDESSEVDTTWLSTERTMLENFLKRIERGFIQAYTDGIQISETFIREMKSKSAYEFVADDTSSDNFLAYQLDTVIPFCQCFCANVPAAKVGDNVQPLVRNLCEKFKEFLSKLEPSVERLPPSLRRELVDCMKSMKSFAKWEINIDDLDKVFIATKTPEIDVDEEREINRQYQTLIRNLTLVSEGLQMPKEEAWTVINRRKLEYKALEQKNELRPLYESFVEDTDSLAPNAFDMTEKIIIELKYAKSMKLHNGEIVFPKPDLHQRYMQALHATLLTEIIKLPPNFEVQLQSNRRKLERLRLAQHTLVQHGTVECALQDLSPHLGNPHLKASLRVLLCLMFHGNSQTQDTIFSFFLQRPDVLVIPTLQSRIASFTDFAMETEPFRKSLSAMVDNEDKNKVKDPSVPLPVNHVTNTTTEEPSFSLETGDNIPLTEIRVDNVPNRSTHNWSNRVHPLQGAKDKTSEKDSSAKMGSDGEVERETVEVTNLVLEFVASACRNQHGQLQNYFREQQPVELSTNFVNILVEVVDTVYSRINSNIVSVAVQCFDCLTQIISGNQENKSVVLNSRVCEQSNFMLFMNNYRDCSMKQVYALKKSVGNFWREMTEETCVVLTKAGDSTADLASTAIEYLDSEVAIQVMKQASQDQKIKEGKKIQGFLRSVGFQYYLLLERKLFKFPLLKQQDIFQTEENRNVLESYSESTRSVELVKDDMLHKLLFRVKDKWAFTGADIKEKIKYGVDRSSSVEKRKDFMKWCEDTTRFAKNRWEKRRTPVGKLLVNSWWFFNVAMLMLTIAILIMIGVDYDGGTSKSYYVEGSSKVRIAVFALGGVHNFLCLAIFIHFVVLQQPQFHGLAHIFQVTRSAVLENSFDSGRNKFDSKSVDSRLQISAFGPKMIYYLLFLAASICGTALHGFTFALCLIQIVELNLYLKRMRRAVTYNGKYFGMLVVFGLIIIYMYGMVAFLFLREKYLTEADGYYCNSMPQCFVTILQHGLVNTTYEMFDHSTTSSFTTALLIGLFNLSFFVFITILGLYIVLAIIVDGFLHLKENMRQAKNDFRAMCFICGRPNGDFSSAAKGYEDHVKKEHNIWDYIYFFIHLDTTGISEYSALENYVHTQLREGKFDFLPMNRALCLEEHDSAKKRQLTVTKGGDRSSELEKQFTEKKKKLKKLPSFKEKGPAAKPKERNAGRAQKEEFKTQGYGSKEVPKPKKQPEEPREEFDIKPKVTPRLQRQEPVSDEVPFLQGKQDDEQDRLEEQKPIAKDKKKTSRKRKQNVDALRSSDKSQKSTEDEKENEHLVDILGEIETDKPEGETNNWDQLTPVGTADDEVKDGKKTLPNDDVLSLSLME